MTHFTSDVIHSDFLLVSFALLSFVRSLSLGFFRPLRFNSIPFLFDSLPCPTLPYPTLCRPILNPIRPPATVAYQQSSGSISIVCKSPRRILSSSHRSDMWIAIYSAFEKCERERERMSKFVLEDEENYIATDEKKQDWLVYVVTPLVLLFRFVCLHWLIDFQRRWRILTLTVQTSTIQYSSLFLIHYVTIGSAFDWSIKSMSIGARCSLQFKSWSGPSTCGWYLVDRIREGSNCMDGSRSNITQTRITWACILLCRQHITRKVTILLHRIERTDASFILSRFALIACITIREYRQSDRSFEISSSCCMFDCTHVRARRVARCDWNSRCHIWKRCHHRIDVIGYTHIFTGRES